MASVSDHLGETRGHISLPEHRVQPIKQILRRIGYALLMLAATVAIVMLERDGYKDNYDGDMSWLDALYYSTVTLSTTGYGDIVPVSNAARLTNVVLITPLRIVFVALLVGTTFEVLTRRTRDLIRLNRWRSTLSGHTIVVGYGTKGYTAIQTLIAQGSEPEEFVVIDLKRELVAEANRDGYPAIHGDATRSAVLRKANVTNAARVIVAADRDDAAVLVSLTVRQLNPACVLVASIREAENEQLLLNAGVNAVITSAEAAGRLLGVAARSPAISEVFNDLLIHGEGLDLAEREVTAAEVGTLPRDCDQPVIAVLRGGKALPYAQAGKLAAGDRLVLVTSPA
ncbi:voltage-gated potassium channel [Allocatelliglobosispora scoriae]|uniref:Voltage-gated potassium channel n=1 Tax=Allocatelliglobosispora scoriae TaxID=643052 RepID=A0A841BY62_9ACTN|nr:potassium channel family protein [Allocatelliglobosispora scoriae]MBB5872486.1 voltage-gated potassium channel [Allocatelliglobosispora scoriae]